MQVRSSIRRLRSAGHVVTTLAAALLTAAAPRPGALASSTGSGPGDWTQFRFGAEHHGSNPNETQLSVLNVRRLQNRWTTSIGTPLFASPAVANGMVYVGGLDGKLHAVDAATGNLRWARPADALPGDTAWTSPVVANGVVYFAANRPVIVLYALDAVTGQVIWTASPAFSIIVASPVLADGVLYIGLNDHQVMALDAATGAVRWRARASATLYSSPAVADGRVFIGSNDRKLYAFDAATGAELWVADTGGIMWSSPTVANGIVYVGSRDDHKVYAFDAATGATRWTFTTGGWVHSSPAIAGGVVYIGSEDGGLYALDADDAGSSGGPRPAAACSLPRPWRTASSTSAPKTADSTR